MPPRTERGQLSADTATTDGVAGLFALPVPPLLPLPLPPSPLYHKERDTFSIHTSVRLASKTHPSKMTKRAQEVLSQKLRIVEDGEPLLEDKLKQYTDCSTTHCRRSPLMR